MRTYYSEKQKILFKRLEGAGELIFAFGLRGVIVNIVGNFKVRKNHLGEDQLDMGDGTSHVHIDWTRLRRFETSVYNTEGVLDFFDGDEHLFRFYRCDGPFDTYIVDLNGSLID